MASDNLILTAEIARKKLQRMAFEIIENNIGENEIILAGIKDSGLIIANIIKAFLQDVFKGKISVIEIDIDKKDPKKISLSGSKNFDDVVVIVTDDVANSGRTLLYALKPFMEFYPKKIQVLVLVERSHKEFPVAPDYVGMSVATATDEKIIVETNGTEILGAKLV
ncbi:phosphoribosyltransferase [Ginsengibacter hankyongi]|uniref:Phosphoribosyltransferase n=1 Tax=Ginsengibacter hankyongi TaxID=2607284 RepID=A0A5J5IM14_9BACT|nr:phosphoribosyltransferase family protein [Ginsengibacter hankyongi]KAA9040502.1 phosphoribosyltransferase [Ginsengibacter hankyongi]